MLISRFDENISVELPSIQDACTVSVMLVDGLTKGKKFLTAWQWKCNLGLRNASLQLSNNIKLISECDFVLLRQGIFPDNLWDKYLELVVTINKINIFSQEIFRFENEFTIIPKEEIQHTKILANSQFSGNIDALLSFKRFVIFLTHKNPLSLTGKKILLSGCGTGAEALILKELGATEVVGYDIDNNAINFAKKRFSNIKNITFTTDMPINVFDIIISRHVMEHIPRVEWHDYLKNIGKILCDTGRILIDVPNQRNPCEPHVDLLFFHYLDKQLKKEIIEYCEETQPNWYEKIKLKMKALVDHKNVEVDELMNCMPINLKILNYEFIDNTSVNYSGIYADTIRFVLSKN